MPKNTKKSQGNKKLQLSDKQFADLLKEIGGGLPEGLALDPALLGALRQATNDQFNKVDTEKYGEIPSDEEEEEMESEQQQQSTSGQKNDQQGSSNNA